VARSVACVHSALLHTRSTDIRLDTHRTYPGAKRKQHFFLVVELFCNVYPTYVVGRGIRMERFLLNYSNYCSRCRKSLGEINSRDDCALLLFATAVGL
jgi:hypothetical protein